MGFVADAWGDAWDSISGQDAAQDAKRAAGITAEGQQAGLDYLKESERVPRYYSEAARGIIGQELGIAPPPGEGVAGAAGGGLVERAQQSPLYAAIMGGQDAGEQAIARSANATGGLRSGQAVSDIAGFGKDLQNQALLQSYNNQLGMLSGLTGAQSYAPQIAQQYSNIGQTQGQGYAAAANARQAGLGNLLGGGLQIGGALLGGPVGAAIGGLF